MQKEHSDQSYITVKQLKYTVHCYTLVLRSIHLQYSVVVHPQPFATNLNADRLQITTQITISKVVFVTLSLYKSKYHRLNSSNEDIIEKTLETTKLQRNYIQPTYNHKSNLLKVSGSVRYVNKKKRRNNHKIYRNKSMLVAKQIIKLVRYGDDVLNILFD